MTDSQNMMLNEVTATDKLPLLLRNFKLYAIRDNTDELLVIVKAKDSYDYPADNPLTNVDDSSLKQTVS